MDRRERNEDHEEMLRTAMDGLQARLWTAMPGIIQSFDATQMTCVVQPAIQGQLQAKDGSTSLKNLPELQDCPCQFPGGGGVTVTFPVAAGDECLVVLASRCIDAWHALGGIQVPIEYRMHDLSDGFALLGFRSVPRVLSDISTTSAQLRSDDGSTLIDLDPTAQTLTLTAPGGVTINADVTVNGMVTATGDVLGGSAPISLVNHVHTDVQAGSSDTGPATG